MVLQSKVIEYLEINGIKKNYLASLLGIYPTQLSKWLTGNYVLTNAQIRILADFLKGKYNRQINESEEN